jgi:spoIIIJ-associated protein
MVYEFEGKTEKEAMDLAIEELGLERDQFDVEILETQKSGFLNSSEKSCDPGTYPRGCQ